MLTAKKLEAAGIVAEFIMDGDMVISTTKHGSRMVCGICGATSGEYPNSDQARAEGKRHECPEPTDQGPIATGAERADRVETYAHIVAGAPRQDQPDLVDTAARTLAPTGWGRPVEGEVGPDGWPTDQQ